MSTFKRYVVIQAMTFVFGIVGPIFLIGYFAGQPGPSLKWMYWWGLFITAADVLIALGLTSSLTESDAKLTQKRQRTTEGELPRRFSPGTRGHRRRRRRIETG